MFRCLVCLSVLLLAQACTPVRSIEVIEPREEYYPVVTRQSPIEPVYSRLTWSHLPRPVGAKSPQKSPLFQPVIEFDMVDATLLEALEALSQTIGYELKYPTSMASRGVSMKLTGTVEEVLKEISRQAKVHAWLDHENRILTVGSLATKPTLSSQAFSTSR